jgi:hypothetical protein
MNPTGWGTMGVLRPHVNSFADTRKCSQESGGVWNQPLHRPEQLVEVKRFGQHCAYAHLVQARGTFSQSVRRGDDQNRNPGAIGRAAACFDECQPSITGIIKSRTIADGF